MNEWLLLCALIVILCICFSKISAKIGLPALVVFLLIGMVFGSDGLMRIHFDDYEFAEQISYFALIFIMFYGGFCLNLKAARPFILPSVILSTVGIVISALVLAAGCHLLLPFSWLESLLIGSVLASTDAASVFSILRMKKLNLKHGLAPILEMESGSNDPFAFLLTMITLSLISGEETSIFVLSLQQIVFGIASGIIIAGISYLLLRYFKIKEIGMNSILLAACALLSYAFASYIGGNGFLSVYLCGIILGNSKLSKKHELIYFFDSISSMMQIILFFMLGLLSFPSQLPSVAGSGIIIALILTFVARPIAVFICLIPFSFSIREKLFLSWCGLRGAASIVFAIAAVVSTAQTDFDIFHIVMIVSLLSITLQGMLLPKAAKWLQVIDETNDTSKTFNDYLKDTPLHHLDLPIIPNHPWIGSYIKDIQIPSQMIVALLWRNGELIVPDGNTCIQYRDHLMVALTSTHQGIDIELEEIPLSNHKNWIGKPISEIDASHLLIVLIKREDNYFIPNGSTILAKEDLIVACNRKTLMNKDNKSGI